MQNSLSIVFSFRNEEDILTELVRRCRAVMSAEIERGMVRDYELIFVNDASSDRSLELLTRLSAGHKDIRIINMSRRFGVAPCVMAGMLYASGDAVVYMDADLQDPPELIPKLLDVRESTGADVVHTVRRSRKGESAWKMFITRIGYWILNKSSSIKLPIEAGDFKLLSRKAVRHLLQLKEHRPFIRGLVCWIGFKQEFVPYDRQPRAAGKTKFKVYNRDVISNFFNSALISFSSAPLRIALILSVLTLIFDFFLTVHVLLEKIDGKAIPGWTAIMIAILFLGGAQLFCVGISGLYLYSMFEQARNRPNYIIESMIGFPPSSDQAPQEIQLEKIDNEKFLSTS